MIKIGGSLWKFEHVLEASIYATAVTSSSLIVLANWSPGHSTPAAYIIASLFKASTSRFMVAGYCVLASRSVTLAGANVSLVCCLVLYG